MKLFLPIKILPVQRDTFKFIRFKNGLALHNGLCGFSVLILGNVLFKNCSCHEREKATLPVRFLKAGQQVLLSSYQMHGDLLRGIIYSEKKLHMHNSFNPIGCPIW